MRVGFAAAVVAAAGIAVAACGSGSVPGAAAPTPSTTKAAAPTSPVDAVEAAYTSTTSAGTAKIAIDMAMTVQGTKIDFGGNGVMDFANKTGDMTVNAMGMDMETRTIDGVEYLHMPSELSAQSKTKPWVKLDLNKAVQDKFGASLSQLGGGASNDPSQILSYLQGVGSDVHNDGPATVDGTATTHYTATMSVDALAQKEHLSQDTVSTLEAAIGKTMTMQLWIDGQNRLRQMSYGQTMNPAALGGAGSDVGPITADMTMKLSDFGTPVNVSAPPADQVTDLN
ncbi:MAG TPA: hypothetical protein VGN81_20605 [Pseudonocardiaceae bacterium]|jgi:hypothetical protein